MKARLDLDLVLPGVPDADDACFRRLRDALAAKGGVKGAHLVEQEPGGGKLCIHLAISSPDGRWCSTGRFALAITFSSILRAD